MALRRALASCAPGLTRGYASVSLTVVRDGVRHDVHGQVGETLANALARDAALASAVPVVSIERGPDAHVYIPDEFLAKMPPLDADDVDKLEDVAIDMGKNSRLASQVTLSSELDGLVAAVGRAYAENPM